MTTQPNSSVSYNSSTLSTRDLRRFATANHLERAMRRVLGVVVTLMMGMPGLALAQSPDRPVVELGDQVSKKQSAPPPTAWRRVKPGREVWVTTNTGSLTHGKIAAISDSSVSIREQDREVTIRLDDVRLVEGRDSLRNGFLIGTVSGAVAGGLMGAAACDGNGPCGLAVLLSAAIGVPVGGLFGMMVDTLIPGRQTLFGGSTTVVAPVITPTNKAIDVAIRWR